MEAVWVPIVVAVITGPAVVVLQKLRKENSDQHAEGRALMERVADKVDVVATKLDEHIGWHKGRGK
jgi:pyrimidine deaminase RibD-like protein